MGESSENFREIVEAMRDTDGIRIVREPELAATLVGLLTKGSEAREVGERGRGVFEAQAGATQRTAEAVLGLVEEARA
jgi:3-deoxy-D-manno-octulosonic-acid transferase